MFHLKDSTDCVLKLWMLLCRTLYTHRKQETTRDLCLPSSFDYKSQDVLLRSIAAENFFLSLSLFPEIKNMYTSEEFS